VQAVFPLKELTPLPCTPPFVSGIVNVRGQVRSVVDLKRILELPETGATHQQTILILHSETMEFGILVDAVLGVRRLAADAGRLPAFTFTERRSEFLKGVTMEQVMILDGETLLSNPGLIVYEEMAP
jgi:purine-binding chemotaxis protein CheW